jgi:hypothetical protein
VCAPIARAATEPRLCSRSARPGEAPRTQSPRGWSSGGAWAGPWQAGTPERSLGPAGRRGRAGSRGDANLFRGNENGDCWPWIHFTGLPALPNDLARPRANSDSLLIYCNGQGWPVPEPRARARTHTHTGGRGDFFFFFLLLNERLGSLLSGGALREGV